MMMNPSTRQVSPLSTGAGFSITSSVCIQERCPQNSPFISQPNCGKIHTAIPDIQAATFIDHVEENKGISWCQDSINDLDFQVMESEQNGQVGSGTIGLISSERTDWSDWDPLISIRDDLDQYWSDLPVNGGVLDTRPQAIQERSETVVNQIQEYQNPPLPAEEHSTVLDPSSNAHSTKPRMRWNQELHEAFVDSVSKLGGSERATPKGILTLMKVPGLTIYHVKSHLQKYRTARYKPEPSEGLSVIKSTTIEDVKSEEVKTSMGITEALRLQVELQKRLHEQLETQRKLQLQIEEQGKYLQKMFEQHKTMGTKLKPSSPHPEQKTQETESETETGDEQTDSRTKGSDSPPAKRAKC